jgi:hypothetical protein
MFINVSTGGQINHSFIFLVSTVFSTSSIEKMGKVDEGSFSGSSDKSATSSLMVIDKFLSSAGGSGFPIGYPASHVTDSCKRHMCLRCLGVLRQPLQMVSW